MDQDRERWRKMDQDNLRMPTKMDDLLLRTNYLITAYNVHMKSEFYREISCELKTRKSNTKSKAKKDNLRTGLKENQRTGFVHPIRMYKGGQSEARGMMRSIDLSQNMKQSVNEPMMRMSFSRPAIDQEDEFELPQLVQNSVMNICCKCQDNKAQSQKQLKCLKMQSEQQKTAGNERFIQMEKKYLLKESELIKLASEFSLTMKDHQQMRETLGICLRQAHQLRERIETGEEEAARLTQEIKKYQDSHKLFNHFLGVFVEQTKSMIYWTQLFQQNYQHLPQSIALVKDDLFDRKVDLDIMLRESTNYQSSNFGISDVKEENNSSFFGSEEDGTESFMKYFKHNSGEGRPKHSKSVQYAEERSVFSEAFTLNKENIDTTNRNSFQDLIQSRLKEQVHKQKEEHVKDEFLRILLTQANSIETSLEQKPVLESRTHVEVDGIPLSSISKKVDQYAQ